MGHVAKPENEYAYDGGKSFVVDNGKFFDSAYNQYEPKVPAGNLPSSFMLDLAFQIENADRHLYKQVKKIQDKLGINKVVWGYKRDTDNNPIWEIYFYHHKKYPENRYENIVDLLRPFLSFEPTIKDINDDYYLISVEMTVKSTPSINLYYPTILDKNDVEDRVYLPGTPHFVSKKSESISTIYKIESSNNNMATKNTFFKISTPRKLDGILDQLQKHCEKILSETPSAKQLADVFSLPFMKQRDRANLPYTIAEKYEREAVGLYFLDISYDNLISFIKYFDYPTDYIQQIIKYRKQLEYLQMDMGFDIKIEKGKLIYQKPCITGTF